MPEAVARRFLEVLAIYLAGGSVVALPLVFFGLGRIDAGTKKAPFTFRLLVLPGVIAMWPLFLGRLIAARKSS
jgi:hypothetical protein